MAATDPAPAPAPPAASLAWLGKAAAIVALVALAVLGGRWAYDWYSERYTVEKRDDGVAISRVVAATFRGASALKVGALSGTVQSTATDTRGFGLLRSDRVVKAPFTVDYFVDLSGLSLDDVRWDAERRRLRVTVPDVTVGRANVDESALTVAKTRGLFVTREAAETLQRKVSANAQGYAQAEAERPQRVEAARANARRALGRILATPLAAAGLGDVTVEVAFPYEQPGPDTQWDRSRSLRDVYAEATAAAGR